MSRVESFSAASRKAAPITAAPSPNRVATSVRNPPSRRRSASNAGKCVNCSARSGSPGRRKAQVFRRASGRATRLVRQTQRQRAPRGAAKYRPPTCAGTIGPNPHSPRRNANSAAKCARCSAWNARLKPPASVGAPQVAAPREMPRPQETQAAPAPLRRDMPPPEMRREERPQPAFQMQEREQRREMPREVPREMPRMERPVQPQPAPAMTPQAMPQREMPRPAPEVRMPPPQPPAPPPPKAEPPRQQPAPQGGNEPHRRRDEERGQR